MFHCYIANPAYKKDDPFKKTDFRPITILPILSKAFKLCLYDQIYEYTDNNFYDIIYYSRFKAVL